MKKPNLTNLWVQGLLMAAVVAAAVPMPDIAFAQLSNTASSSQSTVFQPILQLMSFGSYVIGGFLAVSGVMKIKHHTEQPTSTPLSHGIVRLGAGSAMLALPYLMGMANSTATSTLGTQSHFQQFTF